MFTLRFRKAKMRAPRGRLWWEERQREKPSGAYSRWWAWGFLLEKASTLWLGGSWEAPLRPPHPWAVSRDTVLCPRAVPCHGLAWPLWVGRTGDDTAWQSEGLWWLGWVVSHAGQASPCLGLSGGGGREGLPKLLTPLAVNVFHFPSFLQRATRKSHCHGRIPCWELDA